MSMYASSVDAILLWGAAERVWCLPLLAGAIVAVWFWVTYFRRRVDLLAHYSHLSLMVQGFAPWRVVTRGICLTIALGALGIALMQPQWGRKETQVMQEGRDVLIALDISGSMQAQDVKPSRLAFVKLKIRKLLERLEFERVGLILFSGQAFIQCPLTADYPTFLMFLEQVTTEAISSGTTALGAAIAKSAEVFNRSQNRKNKLLLLVTDGEDFASSKKQLANVVKDEGITVFAWGVGTEQGAPIPQYDVRGTMTGYAKNKDGSMATTALNEKLLKELSSDVGGRYERVTQDDGDIVRIASALAQYEREQLDERQVSNYHDRYPLFVAVAWFFLLLEWLL